MKKCKKFTAIFLAILLLISATPLTGINFLIKSSAALTLAETGQCGDNITYSFDNGVLTLSGTGDMYDFDDGEFLFRGDSSIKRIIIDNGVTSIGAFAFCECANLTDISIPNSVTSIGDSAFEGSGLERIVIPARVTNIGFDAFLDCNNITSITVDRNNPVFDSRNNCNAIIETRQNKLLLGCMNTVIPDDVTSISTLAFLYCTGLTSINIPDSVEYIGGYAFSLCSSLKTVFMPSSITTIDACAFFDCPKITDVYFDGTEQQWNAIEFSNWNDDLLNANIHFHEHSYTSSVIKPATCTKDGVMTYTCKCGENYTEVIPASGHTMGGWSIEVEPTTTVRGLLVRKCKNCNFYEEIDLGFADVDRVKGITLSSNNESLIPREKITLEAIIDPETADNKNVIWSSSDSSIASVSDGVITANNIGSAVIIAKTEDGGYKDFCLIKVVGITASSSSTVIDTESNLIYGLAPNIESIADYVTLTDDNTTIEYNSDTLGTGSVVNIVKNGEVVDSYGIIIFGDVNGDSWYDGMDSMIVRCLANGMLTKEDVSEAVYMAADCNHDGAIDQLDVDILQKAGVLLSQVDQSKSEEELLETSSAYVEYLNLIDQNVNVDENTTENQIEEPYEPSPMPVYQLNIFEKIIAFFMAIWKYIFSFMQF